MRITNHLSVIFISALLTACGGGGGGTESTGVSDPDVLTGVFIDSPVEALRFETATQSGLTNAKGEFSYKSGEDVTFSIGAITLGSASGASQITPFDLFGLPVITTERNLRLLLQDTEEGAPVNDLERVSNIVLLLVSLDNDGNPENGLDLNGWDEKLANASLSFDHSLFDFVDDAFFRFANEFKIPQQHTPASAFTHLYRSLNVSVSVSLLTEETTDENNDGSNESSITIQYDPVSGREIKKSRSGNGLIREQFETSYDSSGNIIRVIVSFDDSVNGIFDGNLDRRITLENIYNPDGSLKESVRSFDNNLDGNINAKNTHTFNYDERGNTIREVERRSIINNVLGEVIDTIDTTQSTFDQFGQRLTHEVSRDSEGDGTINTITKISQIFNITGQLIKLTVENDVDASTNAGADSIHTETFTYDTTNGNQTSHIIENDFDTSTLEPDLKEVITFSYDSNQNVLKKIQLSFNRDSGSLKAFQKETTENSYHDTGNGIGKLASRFIRKDFNNDGVNNLTNATFFAYDNNDRLKTKVLATDLDGDGPERIGFRQDQEFFYDADGNIFREITEIDDNNDENFDRSRTVTRGFDLNNNLISQLSERDDDFDGTPEFSTMKRFTYSTITNGLFELISSFERDKIL